MRLCLFFDANLVPDISEKEKFFPKRAAVGSKLENRRAFGRSDTFFVLPSGRACVPVCRSETFCLFSKKLE